MFIQAGQFFPQLALALVLGAIVGFERERKGKPAGMRTYALVSLGACLFSLISIYGAEMAGNPGNLDPRLIASQVVVGIGFLGAGLIFQKGESVEGLTTAAGLWVSSAIGMTIAFKMYLVSIFVTVLVIFVLTVLRWIEPYIHKDIAEK